MKEIDLLEFMVALLAMIWISIWVIGFIIGLHLSHIKEELRKRKLSGPSDAGELGKDGV